MNISCFNTRIVIVCSSLMMLLLPAIGCSGDVQELSSSVEVSPDASSADDTPDAADDFTPDGSSTTDVVERDSSVEADVEPMADVDEPDVDEPDVDEPDVDEPDVDEPDVDESAPTCDDGLQNGDESDVDCGGGCEPCLQGQRCALEGDCLSGVCEDALCQAARCGDDVVQGEEGCDDGNTETEVCEYGVESCTVCAADCTEQPGAVRVCGDDVPDPEEGCDDGNTVTEVCEYGVESCTVCAADCTEQPGAVRVCGDGVVDDEEECDHGGVVQLNCPVNAGPCEVCTEACVLGPGVQNPAPRVWDGEAGDNQWGTAANWNPDGVPTSQEWALLGAGANVSVGQAQCRGVVIEEGASLSQTERVLACAIHARGTFNASPNGLMPAGRSIVLEGELGARTPWIDTWRTSYVFKDGARLGNSNIAIRIRDNNNMHFVLSQTGFTPLRGGAFLEPNNWYDVALSIDLTRYDLDQGNRVTLMDFNRSDPAFAISGEVPVLVIDQRSELEARVFWDADESALTARVGSRVPLNDVQVTIDNQAPTMLTPIRALASTAHPTAILRYRWLVNDVEVGSDSEVFDAPEALFQGAVVTVEVFAETLGGRSETVSDSVEVVNTPPSFATLEVLPAQPTVDDELSFNAVLSDLDPLDTPQLTECVWERWADGWRALGGEERLAACSAREGCESGERVRVRCQATDGIDLSGFVASAPVTLFRTDCDDADPSCVALRDVPTVAPLDYAFWHWPTNQRPRNQDTWPAYQREMHFVTGHYGMVFNEASGDLAHLGLLNDQWPVQLGSQRDSAVLDALPEASVLWEAGAGEQAVTATTFLGDDGDANGGIVRLSEGGRFMNRLDLPDVRYEGQDGLRGLIEIASMPRHVTFTHRVKAEQPIEASQTASIRLGRGALDAFGRVEWLVEGRALRLTNEDGEGWLFVVYDVEGAQTSLELTEDELIARRVGDEATAQQSISLLLASASSLNDAEVQMLVSPSEAVEVGYQLLNLEGAPVNAPRDVQWDETLGAYRVNLGSLSEAGIGDGRNYDARPELHNWYGRHQLLVDTHGQGPVAVPLAFYSNQGISLSITSGVAMFRDEDGEPIGAPIQMSKNWHDATTGQWYRLYSQPVFSGFDVRPLELTMVSSRWGDSVYAASHGQLSLIGWNSNAAHWDESAMGAFGESITYNPDRTFRSMVDDVRPFLVQAQDNNGRWNWTGNVGGADFLQYYSQVSQPGWSRQLGRVRTTYHSHGPNLTDVVYSGVSLDGAIQADITVQMGRTDDLVRTWYHFDYTFLQDVQYDRLAFFQVAADGYSDNGYKYAVWGNAEGAGEDNVRVVATPNSTDGWQTGYASDADRGIPLEGETPWVMLYDNRRTEEDLPEHYADLMYVVRDFEANIGGTILSTPHINLHRTRNRAAQYGFELGLPFEEGAAWCGAPCNGQRNFIPAGSTVRATVEYIVVPADKLRYYGASDYLDAIPAEQWRTPAMAMELALGNDLSVVAEVGQVRRVHPVEVQAEAGALAARFTLSGGRGYVPVTVHGLMRHDGWRLEALTDNGWVAVDQSVHGNDYWQALYRGEDRTYSLTWNVPNRVETTYRVVWSR